MFTYEYIHCIWYYIKALCTGADPGGAPGARPPKIGKNKILWRKIVIFHTKYPKFFAPPSAIVKTMIFWRKIVIFHTY